VPRVADSRFSLPEGIPSAGAQEKRQPAKGFD